MQLRATPQTSRINQQHNAKVERVSKYKRRPRLRLKLPSKTR